MIKPQTGLLLCSVPQVGLSHLLRECAVPVARAHACVQTERRRAQVMDNGRIPKHGSCHGQFVSPSPSSPTEPQSQDQIYLTTVR